MAKSGRMESIEVEKVASMVRDVAGGMLRERGAGIGLDRCELGIFGHDGTMGGKRHWVAGEVDVAKAYELAEAVSGDLSRQFGVEFRPVVSIWDSILIFGGRPAPDILFETIPA